MARTCRAEVGWRPVSGQPVFCGRPADGGTVSPMVDGQLQRAIPTCGQCFEIWLAAAREGLA